MNKDFVLFNLREAHESLQRIIKDIESQPDYDYGEYIVEMTHLYNHVNIAWNAQNVNQERAKKCIEEDFFKCRQFPKDDIYLSK